MTGPTIGQDIGHGICTPLKERRPIPRTEVQVEDDYEQQDEDPQPCVQEGLLKVIPASVGGVVEVHYPVTSGVQQVPIAVVPSPWSLDRTKAAGPSWW